MNNNQLPVTERIQALEDAYRERGYNREELTIPDPKHSIQKAANSFMDACVLTEALNEGWEPNYDNGEKKEENIWDMRSIAAGGSGFSFDGYYCVARARTSAPASFLNRGNWRNTLLRNSPMCTEGL